MIMPAIISGWLLAFTLSLDDLVIASFVSGPGATTLPMLVFSSVRMGVNPEINALATLILGAVGIVGFIAWYLMARAEKTADTRHPACKTWLKTLKFANLAT